MVRCISCKNHKYNGSWHSCSKCKTKRIYGQMQEPIIEHCSSYDRESKADIQRKKNDELMKSINAETIRMELAGTRLKCFYCKQWVGHCEKYGLNHPKNPTVCPYYIMEEVKRRRSELEM